MKKVIGLGGILLGLSISCSAFAYTTVVHTNPVVDPVTAVWRGANDIVVGTGTALTGVWNGAVHATGTAVRTTSGAVVHGTDTVVKHTTVRHW